MPEALGPSASFDVVGVGLNATDTMLVVPHFPAYGGKVPFLSEAYSPGGQVATAMVACAKLGLRAKYIGTIGDDERGRIQLESLRGSGINLDHVQLAPQLPESIRLHRDRSGHWRADRFLEPSGLPSPGARRDYPRPDRMRTAVAYRWPRYRRGGTRRTNSASHGIPVTVDVDTIYPGFDRVLPLVDYLIASSDFPGRWTCMKIRSTPWRQYRQQYGTRVAAMTLGAHGALALAEGRYLYSPAFVVDCLDTTGAGDVFHGAFCYSVLQKMPLAEALEFSNAMAALNCTGEGARGHVAGIEEVRQLIACGARRSRPEIAGRAQGG